MCIIIFKEWINTLKQKYLNMKNKNKKFDSIVFIDTSIDTFKYNVSELTETYVSKLTGTFEPEHIVKYKICDSDDEDFYDSDDELGY
jgi:hypothetical protein